VDVCQVVQRGGARHVDVFSGSEGDVGGDGGCSGGARQVDMFIVSSGGVDTARQTDVIGINSSLNEVEECLL